MCDAPIPIRYNPPLLDGKGGFIYSFPADCGKCLPCLKKRKQQWSYRLTEQMRDSFSAYFVTLTYDEENVPWSNYQMTANERDHKMFLKELKKWESPKYLKKYRDDISMEELNRKKQGIKTTEIYLQEDGNIGQRRKKLEYYGVIEYGDITRRPHYHYILYNVVDIRNIEKAWQKGRIQVDECNVNTIDYVLKYMLKEPGEKVYEERCPEKSFVSKGMGRFALNGELVRHIKTPQGNMVVNTRGHKVALPRYYRKKYLTDDEAKAKNLYIASSIEQKQKDEEEKAERYGYDKGIKDHNAKNARLNELKRRSIRRN